MSAQEDHLAAAMVKLLLNHAAELIPSGTLGTQSLDPRAMANTKVVQLHRCPIEGYRALPG
ncbi:hypothetical protein [Glutamicibacter ardleyensis]|uniref:hypothetical protein n=1 Tax=Glutamicibacter ardleyensis TaxID=225894 RepID=UPI0016673087|nr:hypothetical protein [Glutamicibacter ardleyensis]